MVPGRRIILFLVAALGAVSLAVTAAFGAAPLPLWQRILLGGEYPGFTPQADAPTIGSLAVSAKATKQFFDALKLPDVVAEYRRDGVKAGISEDLNGPDKSRGAFSAAIQSGSNAQAVRVQKYLHHASLLPCPHSCTVSTYERKISGIPGALGSYRIRLKPEGPKPGQAAFELDFVFFTNGPFMYGIASSGPPNGVDRSQLDAAARRLYERVKGSPPVKG